MKTRSKKPLASKKTPPVKLSFDDIALTKKLLGEINDRAREVLTLRFGLGSSNERETLEAIGERWHITRERVRQIEAAGIEAIRNSKVFKESERAFNDLRSHLDSMGGIVHEDELLESLASDAKSRNRFHFLLVAGSSFFRERETDDFYARWHINHETAEKVHSALTRLYASLKDDEVVPEAEMLERFLSELKEVNTAYRDEAILKRWLCLSKNIACNPLSEWGKVTSEGIRTKGIRDYAYLVVKRNGTPMHFRDVASAITKMFAKKAHVATTHNELMKDSRFVLVGRGLYALSEWGFNPGVVRDVIKDVLKEKPLTKDQVLSAVKKVRYVKDNTILVNLNDARFFKRLKNGTYALS